VLNVVRLFKLLFKISLVLVPFSSCVNQTENVEQPILNYSYPKLSVNPQTLYINPNDKEKIYGIGGSGIYTFELATGSHLGTIDPKTGLFIAGSSAGYVQVVIKDSQGVTSSGQIIILEPLTVTPTDGHTTINSELQIVARGGLAPYRFSLNNALGSIDPLSGRLRAGTEIGQSVVTVTDATDSTTSTTIKFIAPLSLYPAIGSFPTDRPLQLTRTGGEGLLTYTFIRGEGLVDINPVTGTITPNPDTAGSVQLTVTDTLGYTTSLNLGFFKLRSVGIGRKHACSTNVDGYLYCWGGNDQGQIADTLWGPNIGDDPQEMGDQLLSTTQFPNVEHVATIGHTTCFIYSPAYLAGNKSLRCWGAKNAYFDANYYQPFMNVGSWSEQNHPEGASAYSNLYITSAESDFIRHIPGAPGASGGAPNEPWTRNSSIGDTAVNNLGLSNDIPFGAGSKANFISDLKVARGGTYTKGNTGSGQATSVSLMWHIYDPLSNVGSFNHGTMVSSGGGSSFQDGGYGANRNIWNFNSGAASDISAGGLHSSQVQIQKVSGESLICTVQKIYGGVKTDPLSWNSLLNYSDAYAGKSRIACAGYLAAHGANFGPCYYSSNAALLYKGCENDGSVTSNSRLENVFSSQPGWGSLQYLMDTPASPIDGYSSYFTGFPNPHAQFANIFAERNGMPGEKNALDVAVVAASYGGYQPYYTVCGLFDDMALSGKNIITCWGTNIDGLFGIGSSNQNLFVTRSPIATATPPYTYNAQPLARTQPGQLTTSGTVPAVAALPAAANPISLHVNESTICAKTVTIPESFYRLYCWGVNSSGQVDPDSPSAFVSTPREISAIATIQQSSGHMLEEVKGNAKIFCARMVHASLPHKLYCWGNNEFGRLGRELRPELFPIAGVGEVNLGTGFSVKSFSIGASHMCASNTVGQIKCWGGRYFGQLGAYKAPIKGDEPTEIFNNLNKVPMPPTTKVKHVFSGLNHNCLILDGLQDGQVTCFGANGNKQLGIGNSVLTNIGDKNNEIVGETISLDSGVLGTSKVKKIAGRLSTFALADDGKLYAWGANVGSQYTLASTGCGDQILNWTNLLGIGSSTANIGTPEIVPISTRVLGRKVVDVSAGMAHTCVVLSNGEVHCWGTNGCRKLLGKHNDSSILGSTTAAGSSASAENLTRVNLGTGFNAIQVATGVSHTCALSSDYKVKCWGANNYGQLGINVSSTRPHPVPKDDTTNEMGDKLLALNLGIDTDGLPRKIIQLAAGDYHTCALTEIGNIVCWGDNRHGQLGIGTQNNVAVADGQMGLTLSSTKLPTGATAYKITAGGHSTCAVLKNNDVTCWGDNTISQLGLGHRKPQGNTLFTIGNGMSNVQFPE